jgi:acetyl esterase/lipase
MKGKLKCGAGFKGLWWILGAGVVLSTACSGFGPWHRLPSPSSVAAKVDGDVAYGASEDLKMDVYHPPGNPAGPLPAIVYIHGGGWRMGDKEMVALMPGPTELLRRGYLVVSVNYRLAPKYQFPVMLDDVRSAVVFLRSNANRFQLDPERIGVMGDSAGGHLASLLALMGTDGDASSRVRAVVDLYGPSDFTGGDLKGSKSSIKLLQDAFGATGPDDPVLRRVSPVTYVTSNAPPFLILHGNRDKLVDMKQSAELDARLKAAGVDSTFVVITNFAHGYAPWGLKTSPDAAALSRMVADFFDRTVKGVVP